MQFTILQFWREIQFWRPYTWHGPLPMYNLVLLTIRNNKLFRWIDRDSLKLIRHAKKNVKLGFQRIHQILQWHNHLILLVHKPYAYKTYVWGVTLKPLPRISMGMMGLERRDWKYPINGNNEWKETRVFFTIWRYKHLFRQHLICYDILHVVTLERNEKFW